LTTSSQETYRARDGNHDPRAEEMADTSLDPTLLTHRRLARLSLVLGGARSGKSAFAESLIAAQGPGIYLATAGIGDEEMARRVREHRARRGTDWRTVEEPFDVAGTLTTLRAGGAPILLDCLTLWLANLMEAGRPPDKETDALLAACTGEGQPVVMVSNEVGLGIVPESPLGRAFRDHAGRLNQRIAAAADFAVLVTAGLPLILKDQRT
jgi:adenosylcobinamide kinase/adenosylcobinamide-phosphate guanylyltransferase